MAIIGSEKIDKSELTPRVLYHPWIGASGYVAGNTLRSIYCASQQSSFVIGQQTWPFQISNPLMLFTSQSLSFLGDGTYKTIYEVSGSLLPWTSVKTLFTYFAGQNVNPYSCLLRITVSSSRGVQQGVELISNISSVASGDGVWNDFIYGSTIPNTSPIDLDFYADYIGLEKVIQSNLEITGSGLPIGETGSIKVEIASSGNPDPVIFPIHLSIYGDIIP